ncbi:MAG: helix-turn-helix transcriptional regulator [Lentisphaeria bacterium]|nr:helix-turn-helix transcriptional regulator [Lentisphaeria bacterium]
MMETREVWLFRNSFPGVKLPFYPRGGGINCFSPGKTEEHSPQDFCEICWVARGSCIFDFGNIRAEVHAGESIFRLPGERRFKQVSGRENAVIYYVTFDGKSASEIMQSFGYKRGAIPSGKCPVILFDRIFRDLVSTSENDYRKLCASYLELMAKMAPSPPEPETSSFLHECLHRIKLNSADCNFNINALADELGVHRSTINRAITLETGLTPHKYLENCRVDYAVELLVNSNVPISEVARSAGFSRTNYFCRIIKQRTGMTPGELRKAPK